MLIFRLELDRAALREVAREARARLHARGQDRTGWGNAFEKADEELKVEPFVDEQGNILGLLYPPFERIGVTYYVQADRCQCEAWTSPGDPDDPGGRRRNGTAYSRHHSAALQAVWRSYGERVALPVTTLLYNCAHVVVTTQGAVS
jgi:hypothetical protein